MIALDREWLAANPLPEPEGETDKNRRGRVLIAGGSEMVPGALLLTGEAAFRAGAGKVQLATVERAALAIGVRMPEAAVFGLPAGDDGELAVDAGAQIARMLERCDTLVLGPGMGSGAAVDAIVPAVLDGRHTAVSLVIDAAAIGAVSPALTRKHAGRLVLTPHAGEMARLMDCDEAEARDAPERLACAAADRFGVTVALKQAITWIACPGEAPLRYVGGGPGLATGGSGDVLAGIAGALLARGASPRVAMAWAVWAHGEAGRRLAERQAPLGFLARELLPEIPALLTPLA